MANIDFQKLFETLKNEVSALAISTFKKYEKEAEADSLKLLDKLKSNLKTWTQQLSDGKLSIKDFEFLILGQKELIEMIALKQAGLAAIQIDELKGNLLNLIFKTTSALL
jgi:hypothetical protein